MMNLYTLPTILAMAPPQQPGQEPPPFWVSLMPMFLLIAVFYFLLIRPQQKKAKDHAKLIQTLRPGDKVVTSSGIVGVILTVKEKTATLRSADAKFEITKSGVAEILERTGESSES